MNNKILLFIPMYNCEKQIVRVLSQIDNKVLEYITEIIIVNNRSTDNGENAIIEFCKKNRKLPIKLLRNKENYNLGGSHKVAFQYAIENGYEYLIVLHGDDQGNIHDILPYLESGQAFQYDSFLGSRFEKNSKLINYSKFRIFGNHVFNSIITVLLRRKITDLGSGLNMYKVEYLKSGFYKNFINTLTFNVYMLIYGVHTKSNFKFFPLTWREDDQVSNAKFFKQSVEIMKLTLGYVFRPRRIFNNEQNEYSLMKYDYDCIYQSEEK